MYFVFVIVIVIASVGNLELYMMMRIRFPGLIVWMVKS